VRLSRLIDGLLFLARAEDPRTQVEREPVDVGRELAAVREFYEATAAEAGVKLTAVPRPGPVADLNRPFLQRALGNLVANALAHTPPGGAVTLTATQEGGWVRVEVADTGCGIPESHLPYVFDRCYRVDRARSPASGGLGLGLAIVKGIAELHGGSVSLASAVGRGTRVALLLPARPGPDGPCAPLTP
jgi:two-component system heavy metal sensor histidine kinase CusS